MKQSPSAFAINELCGRVHTANAKWWVELEDCSNCHGTGVWSKTPHISCLDCHGAGHKSLDRNVGELLMLVTSELAEAMEGHRKGLMDDKLPHRKMFEVELADAIIRIFDIAGGMGLDLGGAFEEKMAYNAIREDHKPAARKAEGGKKY